LLPSSEVLFKSPIKNEKYKQNILLKNISPSPLIVKNIIISDNLRLNISNIKIGDILKLGQDHSFEVEYTAIDTNYFFGNIEIQTDFCQIAKLSVFCGKSDNSVVNSLNL